MYSYAFKPATVARRLVSVIAALVALTTCARVEAADINWTNTAGGAFDLTGNWQSGAGPVPGTADTAVFNLPNTYNVEFAGNATNTRLRFRTGDSAFDLNGMTYQLTHTGTSTSATSNLSIIVGDVSGGNATVQLTDGVLKGVQARIGNANNANGQFVIDGATWTNTNTVYVGYAGTGELTVKNSGTVSSANGWVGNSSGSNGMATITGSESAWNCTNELRISINGAGKLSIENGGAATSTTGYIGSLGEVVVTGSGSTWTSSDTISIGSSGKLRIEQGGAVVDRQVYLGTGTASPGSAFVNGGTWTSNHELFVGYSGTGELTIENGGQVISRGGGVGSLEPTAQGTVTVTGVGSSWTMSSTLSLAYAGSASLRVENGGSVTARNIYTSIAWLQGNGTISTRGVILDGMNLQFDSTHGLQQTIAFGTGGQLNLNMDGTGDLGAGHRGSGSITIAEGVVVNSYSGTVGNRPGAVGEATVTGTGSHWNSGYAMHVGFQGMGELTIANGGKVSSTEAFVGESAGSQGAVVVDGGTWSTSEEAYIGYAGTGELTIGIGASVDTKHGLVGVLPESVGKAAISGGNWSIAGQLAVGYGYSNVGVWATSKGDLTIENGGSVTNQTGGIGTYNNALGTVTVTGQNSVWTNTDSLVLMISAREMNCLSS